MAEIIGISSGLVALASFALEASKSLYQAVKSFQNNRKNIRDLLEELEALRGVLESLSELAEADRDKFKALNLPLLRCGIACKEFEKTIAKCIAHSGGSRTSFRDWFKLTYLGHDISSFKDYIAGYKSTISIVLGDANIRNAIVTADVLEKYQVLIANTTTDLKEQLQIINEKVEELHKESSTSAGSNHGFWHNLRSEKESIMQCLRICQEFETHIQDFQSKIINIPEAHASVLQSISATPETVVSARQITNSSLQTFRETLAQNVAKLRANLQEVNAKLDTCPEDIDSPSAERERIEKEKICIEQCLGICMEAADKAEPSRINIAEDISAGDEAHQVVVATLGDLIQARRVVVGDKSMQWVGQMSDAALQQLSRDRHRVPVSVDNPSRGVSSEKSNRHNIFEQRHGTGQTLKSSEVKIVGHGAERTLP